MPARTGNTLNVPTMEKIYARTPRTANILDVYRQASVAELAHGLDWYREAHRIALELSPNDVRIGAGVLAALSPMTPWERNITLARNAFANGYASKSLSRNCAKADAIMAGGNPDEILKGDKVLNFFGAIAGDENAVVIDRHAFDIAVGKPTNDITRGALSRKGVYAEFAQKYVLATRRINNETKMGITASELQAVTWCVWRRLKGIV